MMAISFIPQIIMALVYIVGIVIAVVAMPRVGKASVFTIIALVLQLLTAGSSVASMMIVIGSVERGMSRAQSSMIAGGIGLFGLVLHVVGFGLLYAAIFARRESEMGAPPMR